MIHDVFDAQSRSIHPKLCVVEQSGIESGRDRAIIGISVGSKISILNNPLATTELSTRWASY